MKALSTIRLSGPVSAAVATVDMTDLVSLEYHSRHHGPAAQPGRLTARALMLTYGQQEIVLIVLDLMELYEPWIDRFKKALWRYLKVAPENIIVWSNHMHAASGSDGVAEIPLADRIGWRIEKARADYTPVEVARASKDLGPGWTMRRRFAIDDLETICIMFNNGCHVEGDRMEVSSQVRSYLQARGIDPSVWSGDGQPAYCLSGADTRLDLLSLRRRSDRRGVASILRFTAHPVIASASKIGNALYPDYVGTLRSIFEQQIGTTAVFMQGPAGDAKPLHQDYGIDVADAYGRRLAGEALKIVEGLRYEPLENASMTVDFVDLHLRPEYKWSLDRLDAERKKVKDRLAAEKNPRKRLQLSRRVEVLDWIEFHQVTRPTIIPPAALKTNVWPMEVSAVRLGRTALVNLPGEIFGQTGNTIRQTLAKGKIGDSAIITELAGPYANYVSPASEYDTGGYEDTCCFLDKGSAEKIAETAAKAARSLFTTKYEWNTHSNRKGVKARASGK